MQPKELFDEQLHESIIYLERNAMLQAESICCVCHSYTFSLLEDLSFSKPNIIVLKSEVK